MWTDTEVKFADDTVIIGLLHKERPDEAILQLNATKTMDLVINFRKKSFHPPSYIFIKGSGIELVEHYKYLRTVIDNNFKFDGNLEAVL